MSGMIPQGFIDELLDRVNLAEIVGARISLRKAGANFKARCPFHDEKTPSFNVRPDKGFYHCFGCGAHGDAISFIREFDHLGFTEAVETLARHAGMEVPYTESVRQEVVHSRTLTEALDQAAAFYQHQLSTHPTSEFARRYLRERGLNDEIIKQYRLGYAPAEEDALARSCDAATLKALLETRTVSDAYGRNRDLLRNRIVFPIRNTRGRTVAFGGRTLGNDKAKYINSPESDVFHKSREVYGLYEAMQAVRQLDRLLVVEGYMDVIALAQNGIPYAVAALGTATNSDNISSLLKQVRHLIFCFDGDNAGFRAADRALDNCLELLQDGIHIQFLMLPEGEDPDTLVRKEGKEAFQRRIEQAKPLSRFLFDRHQTGLDLNLPEHRGELRARVDPLIQRMARSTLRDAMWHEMMRLCGSRFEKRPWKGGDKTAQTFVPREKPEFRLNRDTMLCLALLEDPGLAEQVLELQAEDSNLPRARQFASWMQASSCHTREDVIRGLALDIEAHQRFHGLFDGIEHLPERPEILEDAKTSLALSIPRVGKALASGKAANPSEWSEEDKRNLKETLRKIGRQKGVTTPSTDTH
ncbi:DNA primase [Mangrovitalea sediminis]|uniref:DNA primase n=1 Tax=Mangrovitalea sediminis TaxID=1982043 RepID=UPI000BE4DA39|nr:DNA primase [Mangrovitalea sediminis]